MEAFLAVVAPFARHFCHMQLMWAFDSDIAINMNPVLLLGTNNLAADLAEFRSDVQSVEFVDTHALLMTELH